jgi:hypothetical protein
MCSVIENTPQCYPAYMQPEQKIIARWMERTRAKLGWSWAEWAKQAKIGAATTLTRAIKDDFQSVTKIETLHALAEAAGEPSVLDFLNGQIQRPARGPAPEALAPILGALMPLVPTGRATDQSLQALAEALSYGLEMLGDQPAIAANEGEIRVAARAAVARFRERVNAS